MFARFPTRILFLVIVFLFSSPVQASLQTPDFPELIQQGGRLASQGEWDRSEIVYLKALQSPIPDHRLKAYDGLTKLYKKVRLHKKAERAQKRLDEEKKFIQKLVPRDSAYYKFYVVQKNDAYSKIAAREKISLEWLMRANDHKPLLAGKTIRIPNKRYKLIVSKKDKTLAWMRGGEVLKRYPVAIGKKGSETPEGAFTIISKVKNPIWYHLKVQIPPDSPKNLLGPRWMGLNVKGYGIHGTRQPKSIQVAASHGCVRMFNRDVEELFEWLPVGTPVEIQ